MPQKVEVVDTVGAGDTFNAGILASLHEQGLLTKAEIGGLSEDASARRWRLAPSGAVTVSRAGANRPGGTKSPDPRTIRPHTVSRADHFMFGKPERRGNWPDVARRSPDFRHLPANAGKPEVTGCDTSANAPCGRAGFLAAQVWYQRAG